MGCCVSIGAKVFSSRALTDFLQILGTTRNCTTANHPQLKGMVERLHRQLKDALRAQTTQADWVAALPLVLLNLRTTDNEDLQHSPSDLVYGEELRLPGQFTPELYSLPSLSFLGALHRAIIAACPIPPRTASYRLKYVPRYLKDAKEVFVRRDHDTPPPRRPCEGSFPVVKIG